MINILLFFGVFILVILLFVLLFILRIVFGGIKVFRQFKNKNHTYRNKESAKKQTVEDRRNPNDANRKIFNSNDGEYVNFEEI